MRVEEYSGKKLSAFLFVACILIGTGLGLLFGRPDVGSVLGTGVGFILMGVFRHKTIVEEQIRIPIYLPATFFTISGIILIATGICMFLNLQKILQYIGAIACIVIGLFAVAFGLMLPFLKRERQM